MNEKTSIKEFASKIFQPLIHKDTDIGIVVGSILHGEKVITSFGNPTFNRNTVFEIGSITKVFTTLALAIMVNRGQVSLLDPIKKFLPNNVSLPQTNFKEIELVHLATHTSGFSRLPPNLPKWKLIWNLLKKKNPYAGYTIDKLYNGVRKTKIKKEPGTEYKYSNFGIGLLGQLLANANITNYESLISQLINKPLNMKSTTAKFSTSLQSNMAPGHLRSGKKTSNWKINSLEGAGGLKSNINDLLLFLNEYIFPTKKEFAEAVRLTLTKRQKTSKGEFIGLGWYLTKHKNFEVWWHNGATGGYSSFIGIIKPSGIGVVILCNANIYSEITKSGFKYLSALSKELH
ncbi:MAG: beta-lactamase family protein [Candidatus Scalindua sp.]|nr:beta-lactamase family protein [Candidatus Scalindua sp.]